MNETKLSLRDRLVRVALGAGLTGAAVASSFYLASGNDKETSTMALFDNTKHTSRITAYSTDYPHAMRVMDSESDYTNTVLIAEPGKSTIFEADTSLCSGDCDYKWTIKRLSGSALMNYGFDAQWPEVLPSNFEEEEDHLLTATTTGNSIVFECDATGYYSLDVVFSVVQDEDDSSGSSKKKKKKTSELVETASEDDSSGSSKKKKKKTSELVETASEDDSSGSSKKKKKKTSFVEVASEDDSSGSSKKKKKKTSELVEVASEDSDDSTSKKRKKKKKTSAIFSVTSTESQVTASTVFACKYVRKEIRSLTETDKNNLFSAMKTMSVVPFEEGQMTYGEDYRSIDYMAAKHIFFSSLRNSYVDADTCMTWHTSQNFVTHHTAFDLEYEKSLQSISPSLALPYWDFTIDADTLGADWRYSSIFSNAYFGSANPTNDAHTVDDGAFANTPIGMSIGDYDDLTGWNALDNLKDQTGYLSNLKTEGTIRLSNAYGLSRTYSNANPVPYLTRSSKIANYNSPTNDLLPSCEDVSEIIDSGLETHTTWGELSHMLLSDGHGVLHRLIGGSWALSNEESDLGYFNGYYTPNHLSQELLNSGLLSCPTEDDCSASSYYSAASEQEKENIIASCSCSCEESSESAYNMLNGLSIMASKKVSFFSSTVNDEVELLNDETGLLHTTIPSLTQAETDAVYQEIYDVLCSSASVGDFQDGGGVAEPLFWLVHANVERMLQYIDDQPDHYNSNNWKYGTECYGTDSDDSLEDFDLKTFSGQDADGGKFLTNKQLKQWMSVKNPLLPYSYDNIDWNNC